MLSRLHIQNYVIIDELEIHFSSRMNVITGETGAGKSIIIGALGLILGERADTAALVNKEKKCVVEGVFTAENKRAVHACLEALDPDNYSAAPDSELIVRREIAANGKSRAFINDTPVNLTQLRELSLLLVDLHQQFDTLELTKNDFQQEVVDALAGNFSLLDEYQKIYHDWTAVKKETEALLQQQQQFEKEADYNRFQFNELEEAGFRENELEEADAELKLLNNAEGIRAVLDKVNYELTESETPLVQQLKILLNQLNAYSSYHPDILPLVQRMQSLQVELQDVAGDVERISSRISYDPARIMQLNDRLSAGYKLQKKHGVSSTNELLAIQAQFAEKLKAVLDIGEMIREKEKQQAHLESSLLSLGEKISASRKKQAKPLEEKVNKLLQQVGMPNARLKVTVEKTAALRESGLDETAFLFDANKSGQFAAVRKVASGGELSRLMLCIKSLVAQSVDLPTLIFDEIDTGISGEAARQVGIIMKELAARRQVICITHQPQIAGKADAHFFVYKEIVKDKVKTNIRLLTPEERITTIAKMLSGEKPTAAAIENAREMLMN
ncbi:MAG: DNA repair protein RecN [Chitinophagaceae bacterium]